MTATPDPALPAIRWLPRHWRRLPRRTVRLRLMVLYGWLFLLSGAGLLAITYALVSHQQGPFRIQRGFAGVAAPAGTPLHICTGNLGNSFPTPAQISKCVAYGRSVASQQHAAELNQLLTESGIALAIMTVASIGLGWLIAGRVLRPLRTITVAAQSISASSLNARLALAGPDDELKELGDTFDGLVARLEAAFGAQRQFVANASHELRTPLALIRLYAETLELGRITTQEKKQQYYRIIRKESERLTALINNILDFSRIEAGRKEYEFRETNIAELVHNTLDSYRYQIEQQGFAFEESIDSNLPPVRVDREAIARALVNLVNNALKYSTDEKFLGVKLYRESGVLKLEVADRGIGIARRDQSKIFEKFYRTGDPLVHNTKGSGLGLSLVRHITKAHGGEIAVESTPGKGSKFTLSLPLASSGSMSEARA